MCVFLIDFLHEARCLWCVSSLLMSYMKHDPLWCVCLIYWCPTWSTMFSLARACRSWILFCLFFRFFFVYFIRGPNGNSAALLSVHAFFSFHLWLYLSALNLWWYIFCSTSLCIKTISSLLKLPQFLVLS
jgi:hypothetical protein